MKRILLIITIFISLSCQAQDDESHDFHLDGCLSDVDIKELTKAINYFESKLLKAYKTESLNQAYLDFLEKFYTPINSHDPYFFIDKDANRIIKDLQKTKTFDKIWISLSTVVSNMKDENGDPILNDPDNEKLVIINENGDFQKCVKQAINNKAILNYIKFETTNPGMSFMISASDLRQGLKFKDLNDDLIRLVLTLGFFYEYAYMQNNYYGE